MNRTEALKLVGKTITVKSWRIDPFKKTKWSGENTGKVIEVTEHSLIMRDSTKTMGQYATTHVGLDRIEEVR